MTVPLQLFLRWKNAVLLYREHVDPPPQGDFVSHPTPGHLHREHSRVRRTSLGPITTACGGKRSVSSMASGFPLPGESNGTTVRAAWGPRSINKHTEQKRDQYFSSETYKTFFESRTKYLPHMSNHKQFLKAF